MLRAILAVTVLDTAYLSWRFLGLRGGWVTPGTGLCSWTAGIDCDVVLTTPEARAFFVPNALLGLGFYLGCALWWFLGTRWYPQQQRRIAATLVFWLVVATFFTLRFWQLLVSLPALCPFCPWNHVLTLAALAAAWAALRKTPPNAPGPSLVPLVALCVGQFFGWLGLWWLSVRAGLLTAGPTLWGG